MLVIDRKPHVDVRRPYEGRVRVERSDISFHDVAGDRVRIQVNVHNTGIGPSAPTLMRIEAAPFGVFVPWRDLAQLVVPALEPGESRQVSTEVARPRPAPLGDFDRVPPRRLLTAISSPDQGLPQSGDGITGVLSLLLGTNRESSGRTSASRDGLPADLWDLVGRGQPHWAGNINVFIGIHSVERHLSGPLRVYPGRTNLAMFLVGEPGIPDAYRFELAGLTPDWKAVLYDVTDHESLVADSSDAPLEEARWVESNGSLFLILATVPPVDCQTGSLQVHVESRSREKTSMVEFSLDPAAKGTGCYLA